MGPLPIDVRDADKALWNEELADFVPQRIYDSHVHLFSRALLAPEARHKAKFTDADFARIQAWSKELYPGREIHYLVLGNPEFGTDVDAHNRMMAGQVSADPLSRMNMLVTPDSTPDQIERDVKELGFVGLKPYRIYSATGDVDGCRIRDFLPEAQMELANELGLWVTMHLARNGGGDEQNLDDLEEYTIRRYPKIRWVLAHCARSFSYWPIRLGIDRLREMPNIWYDMSAVSDVRTFITLFQKEDARRLLFGSDGVDSTFFHGRYVTLGRAWREYRADEDAVSGPPPELRPVLGIYDQLLAMRHAADIAGLSPNQIEGIFWRNAVRELGVPWPES